MTAYWLDEGAFPTTVPTGVRTPHSSTHLERIPHNSTPTGCPPEEAPPTATATHLRVLKVPDAGIQIIDHQAGQLAVHLGHLGGPPVAGMQHGWGMRAERSATCRTAWAARQHTAVHRCMQQHAPVGAAGSSAHRYRSRIILPGVPAHSCSSSPALMITGSTPSFLKHSLVGAVQQQCA